MFNFIKRKLFKRNMESFEINIDELKKKQKNGAKIIDVRSSQEYNEGHLPDAINIPYYEIKKSIDKLLTDKSQEIVLYCQSGSRSKQAYKMLIKLNYNNVYSLYGGMDNWL